MLLLGQRNIRRVKAQVVANSLSKNEVMLLKLMSEFHACTLMFLNNYLQRNPESYFEFDSAMDLLVGKGCVLVQVILYGHEWYAMTDLGYDVCSIIRRRHLVGHTSNESIDYFHHEHSEGHIFPIEFDLDQFKMV